MLRLLEYLNTGETIALVGAGASRELGIPTWPELADALMKRVPDTAGTKRLRELQRLRKALQYPMLLESIARSFGDEFLYSACQSILADPGTIGKVSEFIARAPFKGVLTTNFDDSLARHFRAAGRVVPVYLNTPDDIGRVDFDSVPALVKIHSDFAHPETLVLTASQYLDIQASDRFGYLRDWLKALMMKRVVIIGYSFSDPDIQLVVAQIAKNIKRPIPLLALVAGASSDDCFHLKANYNIEVIPYESRSGTHSELASLFSALSPFLAEPMPPKENLDWDLKRAQSLYLWSRFGLAKDSGVARIDSLKSIILFVLREGARSPDALKSAVSAFVGLSLPVFSAALDPAIAELTELAFIQVGDDETLSLTDAASQLVTRAADLNEELRKVFTQRVLLDLQAKWPGTTDQQRLSATNLALDCLVAIFRERGIEIVSSVFGESAPAGRRSVLLFKCLADHGAQLGSDDLKYRFVAYIIDILTNPAGEHRAYLEHLALAFFSLSALSMDPEGHRFRSEFLSGKALLVDSNVLIPLLPLSGTFREEFEQLIDSARANHVPLYTTEGFLNEVLRHARWAYELVQEHGEQSVQLLAGAAGHGYRQNMFLDGFVRHSVDRHALSFESYLQECLGRSHTSPAALAAHLEASLGIRLIHFNSLASEKPEAFSERDDTEDFIRKEAQDRDLDKSDNRMGTEAEAYTILANWDRLAPDGVTDLAVLSQGTFLNRVAHYGPFPVGRVVVVWPDALYAFLMKSGQVPSSGLSFRELIVSPLFGASGHFIDRAKYRTFFSGLINDAERLYRENLDTLQSQVDSSLRPDSLDDREPLERPTFLASLLEQLRAKLNHQEVGDKDLGVKYAQVRQDNVRKDERIRELEAVLARRSRKKARAPRKRKKRK